MNLIKGLLVSGGVVFGLAITDCPGYIASNVVTTDNSISAALTLNGEACDVYGEDIVDLRLVVEYQSGAVVCS